MKRQGVVVRASTLFRYQRVSVLHVVQVADDGTETLLARSHPMHRVAAATVCRRLSRSSAITPNVQQLMAVLSISGPTAWASATAHHADSAASRACTQHDISRAQGALIMITLSPHASTVLSVKQAMSVIHRQAPSLKAWALAVDHADGPPDQATVDILQTGLLPTRRRAR